MIPFYEIKIYRNNLIAKDMNGHIKIMESTGHFRYASSQDLYDLILTEQKTHLK